MKTAFPTLLLLLLVAVLPNFARAERVCEGLFKSVDRSPHEIQYQHFIHERHDHAVTTNGARLLLTTRLARVLPAGKYAVVIRGVPDTLSVSYDANQDITIRLASRPLFQTQTTDVTRTRGPIAPNISYGRTASTLEPIDDRLVLSVGLVRGNEKTLAGLDIQETQLIFDVEHGPLSSFYINDHVTNWSIYRPNDTETNRKSLVILTAQIP